MALERKRYGARIRQKDVVEGTGISARTLGRLQRNEVQRTDYETMELLCDFFQCEIGDLWVLEDRKPEAEEEA